MNANGSVKSSTKIASGSTNAPTLADGDHFGIAVGSLGDLDGDGVNDLAVGAYRDDTAGYDRGAVHVLFLNANGTVKSSIKIASGMNGGPAVGDDDNFGRSIASLGDLDGDGVIDLAVGATDGDDAGGLHLLMLNANGTVKSSTKIAAGLNGGPSNSGYDIFGGSVASLGDLDGDGVTDLAVGARGDRTSGSYSGAVHVLFMNANGTVKSKSKIASGTPNAPTITAFNFFGTSVASVGDLDGDGVTDLAVGAFGDEGGSLRRGAVHLLLLNANGTVKSSTKIASGTNGVPTLSGYSHFGNSVASLGDLDGDGVTDLAVGARFDDFNPLATILRGAVHLVFLNAPPDFGDAPDTGAGTGTGNYQTSASDGGPSHIINSTRTTLFLGSRVDGEQNASPGVRANGDDIATLPDDEGGLIEPAQDLFLTVGAVPVVRVRATNTTGSEATLFGWIDFNRDGVFDNATERTSVSVPNGTNNGTFQLTFPAVSASTSPGATYARFRLSADAAAANSTGAAIGGEVEDYAATITRRSESTVDPAKSVKIASGLNGGPTLAIYDRFGISVASLGDLDGDGVSDLAVGAISDSTGGVNRGAVHVLLMKTDGTVKSSTKIASGTNGGPTLTDGDRFGSSVASLGDLDGDGVSDLAVGAYYDDTGGLKRGAVHVLLMNADGTVKSSTKIASGTNGGPTLANPDRFGSSVASLGDLDGDGVTDLAVGAYRDRTGGFSPGAVHVLFMKTDGTVKSSTKIASGTPNGPTLEDDVYFGSSVASLGDLDGDGVSDLAVGARGAVHVLLLIADGTVKSSTTIASGTPNGGYFDLFGSSVASLGDLDGDGVSDLAVGAKGGHHPSGNTFGVAVHLLLLNVDGTVKSSTKIASETNGGPTFSNSSRFGSSVASLGDLDGDGVSDLAVGAFEDNSAGDLRGAVHVLFLPRLNTAPTVAHALPNQPAAEDVAFNFAFAPHTFNDVDAGDSLTYTASQSDNSLLPAWLSFDSPNRTFSGTPADGDVGSFDVKVTATDPGNASVSNTFSITVANRNEAPSFTKGANLTTAGDGAARSLTDWATNLSKGSARESGQALDFQVTIPTANATLFTVPPAILPNGTLTFTPKAAASGTVTVTVKLQDDGGTANGGVNLSAAQTFTIQLTGLNKAPSFTKGTSPTVNEDVGPQTINPFAKSISAGTGDVGQTVTFNVSNNNNALFSQQPAISPTGVLTYTPNPNANGVATVTVILTDDGGTAGGGKNSFTTTFTITVKSINDVPLRTNGSLPAISVNEDSTNPSAVPLGLTGVTYSAGPATATDEANQTLTYKITAIPAAIKLFKANGNTAVAVNGTVTATELQGLTYKTVPNLFGTGDLKFTVTDNGSGTAPNVNTLTQIINVTVNALNDFDPTISHIANVTTKEDTPTAVIKFTVDDGDDKLVNLAGITVTATSSNTDLVPDSPSNIVILGNTGSRTIQLKPALDKSGQTTITVTATDSSNVSTMTTFVLTVTPVNDAPRVTATTLSISEFMTNDTPVGTVTAVDPEGDTVTAFTITGGNTGNAFKIDSVTGEIKVNDASKIDFESLAKKVGNDLVALFTLTIKATDALGAAGTKATETGPITVNIVNQSFDLTVLALDSDNTVTVSKVGNNLVARRNVAGIVTDVIAPTPLEDVTSLTITGGTAKDTVVLDASLNSAGSPATRKFTGQIVVNGNNGDDKLDASKINVATFGVAFNGGLGSDTALGGTGHDALNGNDGNDSLSGGAGNDQLTGGRGDDQLLGGAGNDSYRFADTDVIETDTLTEASNAGTDVLDFGSATTSVTAKLTSEVALAIHTNRTIKTSATGTTKLAGNFENVIGGTGDDAILGNAAANSLLGGTGSDTIIGGAGNDTLRGGDGNDTLIGGVGNDQLFGDADTDLGLGGKGGPARGGSSKKDTGDVLDPSLETIDEAFATVFAFE